jgi:hypothetical protein
MGRLPPAGSWVKLVIPARAVGLEGKTVNGMAFTQNGGRVTWDQAGKGSASADDLLALLRNAGVSVTDTRAGANNRTAPRLKADTALGVNVPAEVWIAEYYNNPTLANDPVLARNEGGGFIDRNYDAGVSPAPGIGSENYSTRWTRTLTLTTGTYRFSVTGDDGVRLYIDDLLQIDGWKAQSPTTYNADVNLGPGPHPIRLEYYQAGGPAQARLSWGLLNASCSQVAPFDHWKGEYFNNAYLGGSPLFTRDDGISNSLNFNWGGGGPSTDCNLTIFPDYFSVKWTRSVNLDAANYLFTVNVDNGVRLYVGGQLIIDQWANLPPRTLTGTASFATAGYREIRLEFFEAMGGANVSLSWAQSPNPPSNLAAGAASPSQINLSWWDNSNNEDGFKIERWNGSSWGQINAVGPSVTTYTDSGLAPSTTYFYQVRAYNSIGDSGYSNQSSATTSSCSYAVSPSSASFLEGGGWDTVQVSATAGCPWSASANEAWIHINSGASGVGNGTISYWVDGYSETMGRRSGPLWVSGLGYGNSVSIQQTGNMCCSEPPFCVPCQGILDTSITNGNPRGLTARYFDDVMLSDQPALQRTDAIINFDWTGASPDNLLSADRFSVRWDGQITAPSNEAYTFYLYSDGGARLWVNNRLVIDRWEPSEPYTRSAPVELKADEMSDIRVEYYNPGGKASIHLLWSSASTPKRIIPQCYLHPESATNGSSATDIIKQIGMLLPPGSGASLKFARLEPSERIAPLLSRMGLALLLAGGLLALLRRTDSKESKR